MANYVGIWANSRDEVVYFVTTRDADGKPLDGSHSYVLHFPKANLPSGVVNAYWSLSLVDVPGFRAVPNSLNRSCPAISTVEVLRCVSLM